MSKIANSLRTPKEKTYHLAALVLGAVLWVFIFLGVLAALGSGSKFAEVVSAYVGYAIAFWLFVFISGVLYRATAYGNMVLLSEQQFPQLHQMVVDGARELGMKATPKAFLYNANGVFNAYARRLLGGNYVFLTSALVEANDDDQVRFIIGHELGHHAAGHLNPWLNTIKTPAHIIPFLMAAYSRAREYTSDQIGAYVAKDAAVSRSSLLMLGCGCRRLGPALNCEAFTAQEAMVPPVAGFVTEIFRGHPRLTRRVAAIRDRQGSALP